GIDGFSRKYRVNWASQPGFRWGGLGNWWQRATAYEKYFVYGCGLVWVASVVAWMIYRNHHDDMVQYMQTYRVQGDLDTVANFSVR
ncbi:hypothetical protein ACXWQB_09460, partial [Streptococcus pyogenes]